MNIKYVEEVSMDYQGVYIEAELAIDSSLNEIEKLTIPEGVFAEFVSRVIFTTWWTNGNERHTVSATEVDFLNFMTAWAKAQNSGDMADWEKVQFTLWKNDLLDGNGFVQKKAVIWPMYDGDTPEGIDSFKKLSIALVDSFEVTNVTVFDEYGLGFGANMDDITKTLYLYEPPSQGYYKLEDFASLLAGTTQFLVKTKGGVFPVSQTDEKIMNFLINGGLKVIYN